MGTIKLRLTGKAWSLLLAGLLTAGVWLAAGDATAWPFSRDAETDGGKRATTSTSAGKAETAPGRIRSKPQAMIQGRLQQDGRGQWQIDNRPLVFEPHCTLLDAAQGSRRVQPQDGRHAFLMGYNRGGRFVVYSGVLIEQPPIEPPAQIAEPDQTEAEALAQAGYPGLHPDEVPR